MTIKSPVSEDSTVLTCWAFIFLFFLVLNIFGENINKCIANFLSKYILKILKRKKIVVLLQPPSAERRVDRVARPPLGAGVATLPRLAAVSLFEKKFIAATKTIY